MLDEDQKRPYAATANVLAVLERTRTRNLPEYIDEAFMRVAGIGDAVMGRVRFTLQFLNLVHADGTPTDTLRAIARAPETEYHELLAAAIRDAYAEDFIAIDPAQDNQAQIIDAFRKYDPRSQTARMVMLFLGLCREAAIPVKDAPRERKMQATGARAAKPAQRAQVVRPTGLSVPVTVGTPSLLFGVTEADVAALGDDEFGEVWAALGKVARARARAKQPVAVAAAVADKGNDEDDETDA